MTSRTRAKEPQYSAEEQALDQISREAEARIQQRRQARAEAREIRMREIERQQKEEEDKQKQSQQVDSTDQSRSVSSFNSSRRGSNESTDTDVSGKDSRDQAREFKIQLRELEEKYKKAMLTNAQLDNVKTTLVFQSELLKDQIEEMEEGAVELQREYKKKCQDYENQKRDYKNLEMEHESIKKQLAIKDRLLQESGLVVVASEDGEFSLSKCSDLIDGPSLSTGTGTALISEESAEFLRRAGEGSLGMPSRKQNVNKPETASAESQNKSSTGSDLQTSEGRKSTDLDKSEGRESEKSGDQDLQKIEGQSTSGDSESQSVGVVVENENTDVDKIVETELKQDSNSNFTCIENENDVSNKESVKESDLEVNSQIHSESGVQGLGGVTDEDCCLKSIITNDAACLDGEKETGLCDRSGESEDKVGLGKEDESKKSCDANGVRSGMEGQGDSSAQGEGQTVGEKVADENSLNKDDVSGIEDKTEDEETEGSLHGQGKVGLICPDADFENEENGNLGIVTSTPMKKGKSSDSSEGLKGTDPVGAPEIKISNTFVSGESVDEEDYKDFFEDKLISVDKTSQLSASTLSLQMTFAECASIPDIESDDEFKSITELGLDVDMQTLTGNIFFRERTTDDAADKERSTDEDEEAGTRYHKLSISNVEQFDIYNEDSRFDENNEPDTPRASLEIFVRGDEEILEDEVDGSKKMYLDDSFYDMATHRLEINNRRGSADVSMICNASECQSVVSESEAGDNVAELPDVAEDVMRDFALNFVQDVIQKAYMCVQEEKELEGNKSESERCVEEGPGIEIERQRSQNSNSDGEDIFEDCTSDFEEESELKDSEETGVEVAETEGIVMSSPEDEVELDKDSAKEEENSERKDEVSSSTEGVDAPEDLIRENSATEDTELKEKTSNVSTSPLESETVDERVEDQNTVEKTLDGESQVLIQTVAAEGELPKHEEPVADQTAAADGGDALTDPLDSVAQRKDGDRASKGDTEEDGYFEDSVETKTVSETDTDQDGVGSIARTEPEKVEEPSKEPVQSDEDTKKQDEVTEGKERTEADAPSVTEPSTESDSPQDKKTLVDLEECHQDDLEGKRKPEDGLEEGTSRDPQSVALEKEAQQDDSGGVSIAGLEECFKDDGEGKRVDAASVSKQGEDDTTQSIEESTKKDDEKEPREPEVSPVTDTTDEDATKDETDKSPLEAEQQREVVPEGDARQKSADQRDELDTSNDKEVEELKMADIEESDQDVLAENTNVNAGETSADKVPEKEDTAGAIENPPETAKEVFVETTELEKDTVNKTFDNLREDASVSASGQSAESQDLDGSGVEETKADTSALVGLEECYKDDWTGKRQLDEAELADAASKSLTEVKDLMESAEGEGEQKAPSKSRATTDENTEPPREGSTEDESKDGGTRIVEAAAQRLSTEVDSDDEESGANIDDVLDEALSCLDTELEDTSEASASAAPVVEVTEPEAEKTPLASKGSNDSVKDKGASKFDRKSSKRKSEKGKGKPKEEKVKVKEEKVKVKEEKGKGKHKEEEKGKTKKGEEGKEGKDKSKEECRLS